jgi:hypothetical protein
LDEGKILLQGLFQLSFDHLAHGAAFEKSRVPEMFTQFGL